MVAGELMEVSLFICPRCNQRALRTQYTGDFQHVCFGEEVLQNESVLVIGKWQDYTGSDANVQNALLQGQDNTLFGTRAWIEGQKFQNRDSRGYPVDRFRSRQHIESIPDDFFKKAETKDTKNPEFYEEEHQ